MHIGNNYYIILYMLAVSTYPYFLKMTYRRIAVSVSAYPYPVSVQGSSLGPNKKEMVGMKTEKWITIPYGDAS
jgi:hypothetical protein